MVGCVKPVAASEYSSLIQNCPSITQHGLSRIHLTLARMVHRTSFEHPLQAFDLFIEVRHLGVVTQPFIRAIQIEGR